MDDTRNLFFGGLAGLAIGLIGGWFLCYGFGYRQAIDARRTLELELSRTAKRNTALKDSLVRVQNDLYQSERQNSLLNERVELLEEENQSLRQTSVRLQEQSDFLWQQDEAKSERLQERHENLALLHEELDEAARKRLQEATVLRDKTEELQRKLTEMRAELAAADLRLERLDYLESRLKAVEHHAAVLLAIDSGTMRDDLLLLECLSEFYRAKGFGDISALLDKAKKMRLVQDIAVPSP